ncbi:MAG: hypothetical protein KF915_18700 [Polyangiaceae bacterium]|nr:hypothetical protein [Polyangiaceae bacterium]
MTELKPEAVVKAGGIADLKAKTDPAISGELIAVAFQHPALADRTVVRLAEASLDGAVAAEMQTLGFTEAVSKESVGRTRKRALGFPAWALVHHPKKASFALDVMRDFRKAATRARTKPGHARDAFMEIGKRLERSVPAFLPSFWEQVGRVFLEEDATQMAAQSFEKARAAERAYKLPVDEDQRAAAYLEFTTTGAVPAKSLVSYAGDLSAAFGAEEAARRFVRINVQRIKAGLPPWSGMSKAIGKLTAAIKSKPKGEIESAMLDEIIGAAALKKAAPDFWTSYQPLLAASAKRSPDVLHKLTFLFPTPRGINQFKPTWLDFLGEIGAFERLLAGPPDEIAKFLTGLTKYATTTEGYRDEGRLLIDPRYYEILAKLAPPLIESSTPVDLPIASWRDDSTYLSDLLETALELGLTLVTPTKGAELELDCRFDKDPVKLAAAFPELVQSGVDEAFGQEQFEASAAGKAALAEPRRKHLLARVSRLKDGALPVLINGIESLERIEPAQFAEFPDVSAELASVEVGPALARTLRGGVLDELTWPDYEAALTALGPKAEIELWGTLTHPIVRAGRKLIVFDGPKKLRELDLPAAAAKDLRELLYVDGDLFIEYETDEGCRGVWASKPKAPFEMDHDYRGSDVVEALPIPGGGVTLGGGPALQVGDTPKRLPRAELASDGERFWKGRSTWGERLKLLELDPRTGKTGRASWPEFVREASEATDGLQLRMVTLQALPRAEKSLFGFKDGLVGYARRERIKDNETDEGGDAGVELVRIDGERWRGERVDLLVDWPGHAQPLGVVTSSSWQRSVDDTVQLYDANGQTGVFGGDEDDEGLKPAGFRVMPRAAWLHYLGVRDQAASEVLRRLTDEAASAVLAAAREAIDEDELDDDEAPRSAAIEALKEQLPQLKNEVIRAGVAHAVVRAARAAKALTALQEGGDGDGEGPTDDAVKAALPELPTEGWHDGFCVADMARVARAFETHEVGRLTDSSVAWERALDSLARMGCFLASRTRDDEHRKTLVALLEGFAASGLMGRTLTCAKLEVKTKSPLLTRPKGKHAWIAQVSGACWLFRMDYYEEEDVQSVDVLLEGELCVPQDATVESQRTFTVRDDRAFVAEFLRELAARGRAPWDTEGPTQVAEGCSLTAAEATLLLLGLPNLHAYDHDFLGKELRTEVAIKVTDAKRAKDRLCELEEGQRLELLAGLGDVKEPAALWAPASAEDSVRASLVRTAKRLFGASVPLREEVVSLLDKQGRALPMGARRALTLLLTASEDDNPLLALSTKLKRVNGWWFVDINDEAFGNEVIESVGLLVPFLSAHLPVGDEYRDALPTLYRRVRALLEDPNVLVELGSDWEDDEKKQRALLEKVGGKSIEVTFGEEVCPGRDNGTVIALASENSVDLHVRTSRLGTHLAAVQPFFDASDDDDGVCVQDVARHAAYLMSKECAALVARIEETPVEPGGYEMNPQKSAKELVMTAAAALDVDEDSAALYLQMLTLPNPNKRLILQVNEWTPARYQKACSALTKKKLLLEGKRERAGRDVFLPGAWEKNVGGIPMEAYRAQLYDVPLFGMPLLGGPTHEAFAAAWARWSAGDRPGFEDVEKKRAAKSKKHGKK